MTFLSDPDLGPHGLLELPTVRIASYSVELRDDEGLVGDRASQTAFRELLDAWRVAFSIAGKDPLGKKPSREMDKARLDHLLQLDNTGSQAIEAAMEEYAQQLARVVRAFRGLPAWRDVEAIVIGGGFQESEVGERAISRTRELLQAGGDAVPMTTLHQHADEGALLGWVHLAPAEALAGHDAFLAVDIGGTNVRCGIVQPHRGRAADGSAAEVLQREKWKHARDDVGRDDFVDGMAGMLRDLARRATGEGLKLAPLVGIACPGVIRGDGAILRGSQNLPGDWGGDFRLADAVARCMPDIAGVPTRVLLHNDAVVQGLGELPLMQHLRHWGVLTVGTGLGNASYTNTRNDRARVSSRRQAG